MLPPNRYTLRRSTARRTHAARPALALALFLVACGGSGGPPSSRLPSSAASIATPATRLAALDAARRTLPYHGYADHHGRPLVGGDVPFNFALFPCPNPGPDTSADQCAPLWVAAGVWDTAPPAHSGWPNDAHVRLPVISGRFAVELGAAPQNPLPLTIDDPQHRFLYLAMRIDGHAMASLQRLDLTNHSRLADRAHLADHALQTARVGDLTPEDLGTWSAGGTLAPGAALTLETTGLAEPTIYLWQRTARRTWDAIDPLATFLTDPALMAYYPLDGATLDPTAALADLSPNARHLSQLGGTVEPDQPGHRTTALRLTAGGALARPSFGTASPGLTVSLWIHPEAHAGLGPLVRLARIAPADGPHALVLFGNWAGCASLAVGIFPSGTVSTGDGASTLCSTADAAAHLGRWTHVVATFEGRVVALYRNGERDNSMIAELAASFGGELTLDVGHAVTSGGPVSNFSGRVDELAIFDRALSAGEIAALYRDGVHHPYPIITDEDGLVTLTNVTHEPKTLRLLVIK